MVRTRSPLLSEVWQCTLGLPCLIPMAGIGLNGTNLLHILHPNATIACGESPESYIGAPNYPFVGDTMCAAGINRHGLYTADPRSAVVLLILIPVDRFGSVQTLDRVPPSHLCNASFCIAAICDSNCL